MESQRRTGGGACHRLHPAKHILIRSKSTAWFGTDHTVNLYRGCCHGCLYCDSRSDCYRNPNFDQVTAKADALRILRDELARKVRPAFVGMGAMSDPYNPFEEELLLTRHALELIDAYDCGVSVDTKQPHRPGHRPVSVHPGPLPGNLQDHRHHRGRGAGRQGGASGPLPRPAAGAIRKLAGAGLFCGVLLMPVLPFLEDRPEQVLSVVDRSCGGRGGPSLSTPASG